MKRTLIVALGALLCSGGTAAAQDDDWEFQEDTVRGIAVAAARYDAGQMIVVQCRDSALTAVLAGLPQSAEPLTLNATRADGRQAIQGWLPAGVPGAYKSASPGRDVRFMRGGGLYSVQTSQGETTAFRGAFDLPTQSANLDRVLSVCGWATSDDRDLLPDAVEVTLINPLESGGRARMPTRRGATTRAPRQQIELPPPPAAPPAELAVSCIVREMHLRDCRADHPPSADNRDVRLTITTNEGRQVYPIEGADPAASEGKRVSLSGGRIRLFDYIMTVPAG
jgi:hypothetical protein